jgi:hypothetical protein
MLSVPTLRKVKHIIFKREKRYLEPDRYRMGNPASSHNECGISCK